jgi:2-dehydro-3-deoxyphosphogluconate aldolase/(4S)-4-hydroxy-2-oxoglutarate aldolase
MVILRGLSADETVTSAHAAWDIGIDIVEVPIGSLHKQLQSLQAAVEAGRERGKAVGAGTVITPDHAHAAADAGAAYTVAPGFDPVVLHASADLGLPHLPGVATATEVQRASQAGCRWLKAFPANTLGSAWFRAMLGPFPKAHFVATGAIAPTTATEYFAAGVRIVAFGSAITDTAQRSELRELVTATLAIEAGKPTRPYGGSQPAPRIRPDSAGPAEARR